jgi:hypothetical protein
MRVRDKSAKSAHRPETIEVAAARARLKLPRRRDPAFHEAVLAYEELRMHQMDDITSTVVS